MCVVSRSISELLAKVRQGLTRCLELRGVHISEGRKVNQSGASDQTGETTVQRLIVEPFKHLLGATAHSVIKLVVPMVRWALS